MKRVIVLIEGEYDCQEFRGVFSTREKAVAYAKKLGLDCYYIREESIQ